APPTSRAMNSRLLIANMELLPGYFRGAVGVISLLCSQAYVSTLRLRGVRCTAGFSTQANVANGSGAEVSPSLPHVRCAATSLRLLDHFVGAGNQRNGQLQAKGFCRLQVDHQLEFGRRLHRQFGRLLTLEDAIDVTGCPPELVEDVRPVADQA